MDIKSLRDFMNRFGNPVVDDNKKVIAAAEESSAVERNIYLSKTGTAHRPGCRYWRAENLHTEDEVNADLENLNWGNCCGGGE